MHHDSINYIQYEKDRLAEIYSLLYPNEHVLLFINEVNVSQVTMPKKIQLSSLENMELQSLNATVLHIGPLNQNITKAFLISTEKKDSLPSYISLKAKQKYTNYLKKIVSFCLSFFPLLHELVLEWYFRQCDKKTNFNFNKIENQDLTIKNHNALFQPSSSAILMIHWLDIGGAEKFAIQTSQLLTNQQFHPYIIVSHISPRFYFSALAEKFIIYELDRQIPRGKRITFLLCLIKEKKISLIHNHHSNHFYRALPFIKQISPAILTIDSLHIDEKKRHKIGFPRRSIVWTNYIDYHHVISKRLQNLLLQHDVSATKILYGHLGNNLALPAFFNITDNIAKKRLTFCFVGRMATQKRPLMAATLFIAAINLCRKNSIEPFVNVIGEGFYLTLFKNAIKYSGLSKYVHFYPGNSDVRLIMQKSDILLISSENEGLTLVAFEALNEGCLVISTDVGGQNELVPDSLLLPPTIIQARNKWIQILLKLLKDSSFRNEQQMLTREKAIRFKKNKTAHDILTDLYQQARKIFDMNQKKT